MSHSPELIALIRGLIEADYPSTRFETIVEQMLPGTRMFPDIRIVSRHKRSTVCVVEIGYTRPEKLSKYHELKIPDVRWYDKSGMLHTPLTREARVIHTRTVPVQTFYTYFISNRIACVACPDCFAEEREGSVDEVMSDDAFEAAFAYASEDVESVLITDYAHWWMPSFCDQCGLTWMTEEGDTSCSFFLSPVDLGKRFGRRQERTWDELRSQVADKFNLELVYEEAQEWWE